MNSKVELWVSGTGATDQGRIDLYPDEPISISMANSDIKDIKIRKSSFTQSFVIPGTKNNNIIFNSIFNIGADSTFDPRKKTKAYLLVDSIPVMQNGNLQLTGILVDERKNIEYEVSIFDETENFIDSVGDNYLTDLEFGELDHVWNYTNVTNTWVSGQTPYYYPLIDYGYDFNLSDMNTGAGVPINWLIPATQVKYTWDKIFSAAGYSYNSSFLSGSYFTNLFVPFNSSAVLTQSSGFTIERSFQAQASGNTGVTLSLAASPPFPGSVYGTAIRYDLPFTDDVNAPNFDNGGLYSATSHTYSSDTYSNQIFNVQLNYQMDVTGSTIINYIRNFVQFFRSSFLGGASPYYQASDWPGVNTVNAPVTTIYSSAPLNDPLSTNLYPAQPGETFWVRTFFNFTYFTTGETVTFNWLSGGTFFYNTVGTDAFPGQTINYNNFIPKKIKQIDFINSIITMHNLYVTPDKNNSKVLKILPRSSYYSGGTVKDWTKKFDEKVKIKEQLISEQQNKRIILSYAKDSDYYNSDYQTITNKIFGDYYWNIDNDFTKGDKKIDVIFSPTPGVAVLQSSTSTTNYANEFVVPKIGKRDSSNNFGKTDSNIRILQKNAAGAVTLNPGDTWKLDGNTQTTYPYLGMLNHPGSGDTDIAFGTVDFEYYTLSAITQNNLVNAYWQEYLEQISDKDAKLITANFYLTPADIQSFDFSDSIYVDGMTDDGGHYFIVNKITYVPTSNQSSQVELIKVKNKFVNTTKKNNVFSIPVKDAFQSISRGGGNSTSTGTVAIGPAVFIGAGANRSFAMGNDNTVGDGAERSFIMGSGSTVYPGTQGAVIFGNDVSATTSNTVYVPNIIIAPGGSINGTSFSALTATSYLWSASTGPNTIIANNGTGNIATNRASIVGGYNNQAGNNYASIFNGYLNRALGVSSLIGNGYSSLAANGNYTTVLNGLSNSAITVNATVLNGQYNFANNFYSTVVNGFQNNAGGLQSTVINGQNNTASTNYATVLAGSSNSIYGAASFGLVGNGSGNSVKGAYGTILNGIGNISQGSNANVLAGYQVSVTNNYSSIVNGAQNNITSGYATILNGASNTASGMTSTVLNGSTNNAGGQFSTIGNGFLNRTAGYSSVVLNGIQNYSNGKHSTILNGASNTTSSPSTYSSILGGTVNSVSGISSTIINGSSNLISSAATFSTIINGFSNSLSGSFSTIIAGSGITSSLNQSAIAKHYAVVTGGTDNSAGIAILVGGTVVVNTTKVTNASMIQLTHQNTSGTLGHIYVSARTAGTSFTITSSSGTDTSTIFWQIWEPAQ